jgi:hypothetical protein
MGNRESLAGTGGAEQRLVTFPSQDAFYERFDRLRLIALRCEIGHQFKLSVAYDDVAHFKSPLLCTAEYLFPSFSLYRFIRNVANE